MNSAAVFVSGKKRGKTESKTKNLALKALKILKQKNSEVEIFIIGAGEMRRLNKKYRGKNKTAGVLSFETPKNFFFPGKKKHLGEIYLNSDFIKSESGNGRLKALLIHGLLHLLHYDHKKKNDRIIMEKREKELCISLL